jgi:hypothetical protein
MWKFTELAEWWEGKHKESDAALDGWVESSNYSEGAMIVAASTKALMTFGAGFVDVLRLGDGVKDGTLKGMGTDAMRALAIFPVGKAANLFKSARGVTLAKVVVDTGGPNCFWVASAKAFTQIGQRFNGKLLVSVEDLAKALGMPMTKIKQIPNLSTGIGYLKELGAKVGPVRRISDAADIAKMVPLNGGVVMIAVHVKRGTTTAGHAFYAYRNSIGQIRYMDREVGKMGAEGIRSVFTSIEEIGVLYGAKLIPYEAALIENVVVKSVLHEAPRLFIPILGVIATNSQK